MKKGTKLLCIDAKEYGIPIKEGETYQVLRYYPPGHNLGDGLPGDDEPGVELKGLADNFFKIKRFRVLND